MLIFLDIDGVMVPAASWKAPELREDGFPMFTPRSIEALKSLLSFDAYVILTTSHRDRFSIDQWKEIFERRGLKIDKLDRLSPVQTPSKRKDEIQEWFDTHNVLENFVIIDDDKSLYGLPAYMQSHLVITSSLVGLTPEILNEANLSFAVSK